MKRRIVTGVALGLGLLGLALAGLIAYRTSVAEWWLSDQLTRRGFAYAELKVAALGLGEARIAGISAGRERELQVDEVTLTYRWPDLFAGRFAGVSVAGLTLNLDLTGEGPPLGSLDEVFRPLLAEGRASEPPDTLPNIEVRDAKMVARSRIGPVVLTAGGRVGPIGERGTPGAFDFTIAADEGRIAGRLAFSIDAETRVDGTLSLEPGILQWPVVGLEMVVAGGTVEFLAGVGTVERLTADLALDALRLAGKDFGSGTLAARLLGQTFELTGAYGDAVAGSGLNLSLAVADWRGDPHLTGDLRLGAVAGDFPWQLGGLVAPTAGRADIALGIAGALPPAAALREAGDDPLALLRRLDLTAELDLRLTDWALPDRVAALNASLPATARLAGGRLDARISGGGRMEEAAFVTALLERAALPTELLGRRQEIALDGIELAADLTGPAPELRLVGDVRLAAPKRLDVTLGGEARFAWDEEAPAFGLFFEDVAVTARSSDLRGLPLGAFSLAGRLGLAGRAVTLALDALRFEVEREGERPLPITGHSGALRIGQASLRLEDWHLDLPEQALVLDGLSATLPLQGDEALSLPFEVAAVRDASEPPRFAAARLEGRVERDKGLYRLAAELTGPAAAGALTITGVHDPEKGRGHLRLGPKRVVFQPEGLQPGDFSPRLKVLREAAGRAEVESEIAWGPRGTRSQASLAVDGFSLELEGNKVSGLGMALRLTPLFPAVASPPSQRLTARKIESTVAVENLSARFRILPQEPAAVLVEQADFSALGGRFRIADTLWVPERRRQEMAVQVLDLDLAGLLKRLNLEGVKGSGEIVGVIPVRLEDGRAVVADAQLRAKRPGRIQFKSDAAAELLRSGGEPVKLLLQALENFHYEVLSLTGSKDAADEIDLKLQLLGKNPAVLEGRPFKFNINLSGNIGPILDALAQGTEVSGEALRRSWRLRP